MAVRILTSETAPAGTVWHHETRPGEFFTSETRLDVHGQRTWDIFHDQYDEDQDAWSAVRLDLPLSDFLDAVGIDALLDSHHQHSGAVIWCVATSRHQGGLPRMAHDAFLAQLRAATTSVAALAAANDDFEALYQAMADAVIDYQRPENTEEEETICLQ